MTGRFFKQKITVFIMYKYRSASARIANGQGKWK